MFRIWLEVRNRKGNVKTRRCVWVFFRLWDVSGVPSSICKVQPLLILLVGSGVA